MYVCQVWPSVADSYANSHIIIYFLQSNSLFNLNDKIRKKFKKSDWELLSSYKYYRISKFIFLGIIIPKFMEMRQLFHVKMLKINMFRMDVWIFWSQLSSCYAFYIVLNYIMNHHTEIEIDRTIMTYLNQWSQK